MNIDADTKLYCLIGNPVSKSLSPKIHNLIFNYSLVNAKYLAFNVEKEKLKEAVLGIKALGIKGFNVTIPFKIEIMKYLDEIDHKAKLLGAVNTVLNINGKLKGFNTDGDGFIKTLTDLDINLKNKRIAIIGAGGAANSIIISLAQKGVGEMVILNRTLNNAIKLKKKADKLLSAGRITCMELSEKSNINGNFDIWINTTPVGMYPNDNQMPISKEYLKKGNLVYDIIYKPRKTKLLIEAEKKGCKILNGLDMLINQAIYSQEIWKNHLSGIPEDFSRIKKEVCKIID